MGLTVIGLVEWQGLGWWTFAATIVLFVPLFVLSHWLGEQIVAIFNRLRQTNRSPQTDCGSDNQRNETSR